MADNKKTTEDTTEKATNETESSTLSTGTLAETNELPVVPIVAAPPRKPGRFKRFWKTKRGKAVVITSIILVIAAILMTIPTTRYAILGNVIKKSVHVVVMDSSTMKPVSQAAVTVADKTVKTDKNGEAILDLVPVGDYTLKVTKGYYRSSETKYEVPVIGEPKQTHISFVATGRQVTLHITNKITAAALAGARVNIQDTSAVTDDKGVATIVLPADKKTLQGDVSLDGYNQSPIDVKVTDQADANTFALTPAGEVFYLSKQTGKINVMKARLDGANASVIVEGTGNEKDGDTVLLAARDWNYMALSATRDAKKVGQLYLVDAKSGKLTTIDEGDATFQLVGWSDHRFIYLVTRNNKKEWEGQIQVLKSFNAETGKLSVLDESTALGTNDYDYQREFLQNTYILEGKIVYVKRWYQGSSAPVPSDKKSAIMSVNPDGDSKQRVKEFGMQRYIDMSGKLYEPQEIYFRVSADSVAPVYYAYENSAVKSVSNTDDKFYTTFYPTYLVSPDGKKTFWYEPRDGKNTLLVGDKNGKDGVTLASRSEYKTYGWYGDKYILLTKNDSELYVAASDKVTEKPVKITDYHKPDVSFPGYGYGYGGQ